MENNSHTIMCIMGRTASGKDSLVAKLCERNNWNQLISYTTRPRRKDEGETHHFVTEEDYEQMRLEDRIAAYTKIGEYRYWSTIEQLFDNDLYIIDPIGVRSLKELNIPNLKIVTVYINVPDDVRKKRALEHRHDDKRVFISRELNERQQFNTMLKEANFDYSVSNIDFANAYSVLKWICTVEGVWQNHNEEGK